LSIEYFFVDIRAYFRHFLGVCALFLLPILVNAQAYEIHSKQFRYPLNQHLQVLSDINGTYTAKQVLSPEFSEVFQSNITINKKAKVHWLKLKFFNYLDEDIRWHLWVTPFLDNKVFCFTDSTVVLISENGKYVRNSVRCFPENPKVIPVTILPNQEVSLLIRVDTSVPQEVKQSFDLELRLEKPELKRYRESWIVLAVLVGILISLGFYILLQYFLFRDKGFLYFFLCFFFLAMYFLLFDRVSYALFRTDYITRFTGNYVALLSTFFYIGFTRHFLDPNNNYPSWHRLLKLLQVLYIIPFVLIGLINLKVFWDFSPFVHSYHVIVFIFLLVFATIVYRRSGEQAGYYLLANSVFFIFLCLFIVFVQRKPAEGYSSILLESSLKIGSLGQVLLFTLALANRFSRLSRQVVEKQLENERLEKDKILEIQETISKVNLELEDKVRKRTAEISHQKEELETQAEHLERANHEIFLQKSLIEKAHTQITDSLYYAAIIQQAVLPKPSLMKFCFKEHFTLFMPRDIVSGDFYWTTQVNDITLFAVADCTGHGVPGAFMSMLGISLLNEIVKREGLLKPDEILNLLRVHLINALQQEAVGNDIRDGMDISLCSLYKEDPQDQDYVLEFAEAHNSALLLTTFDDVLKAESLNYESVFLEKQDGISVYQLKADLMPISMHFKIEPFSRRTIRVRSNDMVYLYTDGITDQIGGPEYKKMSNARLRNTFLNVFGEPPEKQRQVLEQELIDWMNQPDPISGSPCDQIDDICVLGVRIP